MWLRAAYILSIALALPRTALGLEVRGIAESSMRALALSLLLPLLGGCASTTEAFLSHNPMNEREASVQFIRPNLVPYAFVLEIYVDDKKAATLANLSEISFSVPAGNQKIDIVWVTGSLAVGSINTRLAFKGNESRHFLVTDRSKILGQALFDGGRLSLMELTRDQAQLVLGRFPRKE
jgi:hypothetical protein